MKALNNQAKWRNDASLRCRVKLIKASGMEKYDAVITASAPTIDHSRPGDQVKQ